MSNPLVRGKGTKYNSDMGPFGRKRGGKGGKGDIISGTFGEGWEKNIEDRLASRTNICGNPKCNIERPAGVCKACGWEPKGNSAW